MNKGERRSKTSRRLFFLLLLFGGLSGLLLAYEIIYLGEDEEGNLYLSDKPLSNPRIICVERRPRQSFTCEGLTTFFTPPPVVPKTLYQQIFEEFPQLTSSELNLMQEYIDVASQAKGLFVSIQRKQKPQETLAGFQKTDKEFIAGILKNRDGKEKAAEWIADHRVFIDRYPDSIQRRKAQLIDDQKECFDFELEVLTQLVSSRMASRKALKEAESDLAAIRQKAFETSKPEVRESETRVISERVTNVVSEPGLDHVSSYTRKDGTFVGEHVRTKADGIESNNLSAPKRSSTK